MGFFQDLKEDLSMAVDELATDPAPAEGKDNKAPMRDEELARQLSEMTQAGAQVAGDAGVKETEAAPDEVMQQEEKTAEDTSDVMPSKELAAALEAADVIEQPADAISPDGKAAPVFGEQMELNLSGAAEPQAKTTTAAQDAIEAAASELANIASIVNKDTVSDVSELEEKPIQTPQEMLADQPVEQPAAPAEAKDTAAELTAENLGTEAVDENAVITKCMTVKGDILSRGSVEIIGCVEGSVTALGKLNVSGILKGDSTAAEVFADAAQISGQIKADGTAKIGKDSVIIGNIYATSAVIAGAVKGDIDVHGPVILDSSAIVMGNIRSKSVQINNGAAIEGLCSQCYADNTPSSFFDKFAK